MAQSLFEHGRVRTTLPKALEVQPFVEKLITVARKGTLHARRQVIAKLRDRRLTDLEQEFIENESGTHRTVVQKLFEDIAPRFGDRPGGYTRIIKLPKYRIGDGGDVVMLQLVGDESEIEPTGTPRKGAGHRRRRAERRFQFAKKVAPASAAKAPRADNSEPAEAQANEPAGA
jgi:large subunit ribosomal protein L17